MEKFYFRSLAFVSLLALGVGCGQQAPGSEPVGRASQALSTGLVISSVYGGGGSTSVTSTYNSDYVELFNRGTTAVSLAGLSLQYTTNRASDGAATFNWQVVPLPSGTIEPGHYYLIRVFLPSGAPSGAALPTVDFDATMGDAGVLANYGTASGTVALVDGTTKLTCAPPETGTGSCDDAGVMDFVAYGVGATASGATAPPLVFEGTAGAPTPGSGATGATSAVFRKGGGCVETDDNGADFEVKAFSASVTPRNSASPAHLCSLDGGVDDAATDAADDAATDAPADAPADSGTASETGSDAADTGTAPEDTGTAPEDTGTAPEDTGTAPADTGSAPEDTGTTAPAADTVAEDEGCGCRVAGRSGASTTAGAFAALALAGVIARRRRR